MVKTVEQLKRMYSELTDNELIKEYHYRMSISTRFVVGNSLDIVYNSRKAVTELMRERGLEPST